MSTKKTTAAADEAAMAAPPVSTPEPAAENKTVHQMDTEKPDVSDAGFCAYIGPTIIGVIQSGTIYHGSKTDALKSAALAVEKYPLVADLIVPGDTLAADRIKVKTPGNLLHVNYRKLASGKNK